jgi:heme/copper-type cytochrome/quinol oxidase subunit 2
MLILTRIVEIVKSNRPPINKLIWCLVVFFFPVVGMIIYYLFSNRESHNSSGYEAIGGS